ncbi:MAG: MerR family transcriptional regulator [Oscillospiraceae bacterium]
MNDRKMTVHEVADLTGITIRALHYYDEIGLLKPTMVTGSKYRLYSNDDLSRLQEILFFREVGFSLKEIKNLLSSPNYRSDRGIKKTP